MLPMVGNVEEARHILKSMKYTPDGGRGVALQVSHDRYRPGPVVDKFVAANRRSTFFCQIETAEGVENADAIAALPGVDCLWVGHFDLSVSLGVPGEFGSKTFTDAIARVCDAARKHGKSLGRLVPTVQQGVDLFGWGFDFICYSGDVWVLHDALKDDRQVAGRLHRGGEAKESGEQAMSGPFRVALSGDFRKPDGSPVYPDFDLEPLRQAPNVEFLYLEPRNPVEADQLADFDALILLRSASRRTASTRTAASLSSPASALATTPSMWRPARGRGSHSSLRLTACAGRWRFRSSHSSWPSAASSWRKTG